MTAFQFDEMIAHTWSLPLHAEIRCAAEPFTHLSQEVVALKNKMHQMVLHCDLKKRPGGCESESLRFCWDRESAADTHYYRLISKRKLVHLLLSYENIAS